MNWTEQAEAMLQSLTETQKMLREDWGERPRSARRGAAGMTSEAAGVPRDVAERLLAAEQVFLRFIEVALEMLKKIAPNLDAGDDWADLLRSQIAQMKEEMTRTPAPWNNPEAVATVANDLPELWRLYLREAERTAAPWFRALDEARGQTDEATAGNGQAAIRLFNVFMDTFETSTGKLTATPAIGYTRELQEKVAQAFEAWVDVRRAELDFRTELVDVGFQALERLVRELVELGERGEKIESFRALFDLWVTVAEKTYFEIAGTDAFAKVQGRLVNAATRNRIREQEVIDTFLESLHLPTRREVDKAYRHLHELKAEVRALRKELAEWKEIAAPATSAPAEVAKTERRKRSPNSPREKR